MKRTHLVFGLILLFGGCHVFSPKVSPYPDGILFPVEKAGEFLYDGEIFDRIQKKENSLYFNTRKGFIYCLDASDYSLVWQKKIPVAPKGPVFIGENQLYIVDEKNTVYGYDLAGNLVWQVSLEEEITSPLKEMGGSVFLGTSQGRFIALDAASGTEAWAVLAQAAIRSNPVEYENQIIFGCDDHTVYFLDKNGNQIDKYLAEDKIFNTLLVDGKYLYFGTENHYLVCLDLKKKVKKWEVKTGGSVLPVPVADEKRVFFLAWNNVLYCLHKRNGSILWWQPIPSRSHFALELHKDKIVVSSMSSLLVCFSVETGARVGNIDVGKEMKSNPLWNPPFLLVNVYDRQSEKGTIIQMKKTVQITLTSSVVSPQFVNQEIALSTAAVGFFRPQYEFYVGQGEEKNIVQAASEKSTFSWYPSQSGSYVLGVTVRDEKVDKQAEIPFVIEKIKPKATLLASKPSPQEDDTKILLNAGSAGFTDPAYELRIQRVNLVLIGKRSVLSLPHNPSDNFFLEKSESENWTWTPSIPGFYKMTLVVTDESERLNLSKYFVILNKEELKELGKIKKESQP